MTPNLIQRTLAVLRDVERQAFTPEQLDALRDSRTVLHFILGRGESGEFTAFFERFDTAPLTPLLSFPTLEEADAWLRNHPAPPHGAIIRAANELYSVADVRELHHRKLLRLPSPEEASPLDENEEAQDAEEEAAPPTPRPDTSFSLLESYKRTCYHLSELEKRLSSHEQLEATRAARISFDFVMRMGEEHGFEDYLEGIRSARTSPTLRSFASREEADTWLMTQPEPPPPTVVAIGSNLYVAGYNRRGRLRVLTRLPAQQELDTGAA